jgi:hypothetical protein
MQNMAKMMMMVTFVKIGMMKLKTGLTYMNIQENKILHTQGWCESDVESEDLLECIQSKASS